MRIRFSQPAFAMFFMLCLTGVLLLHQAAGAASSPLLKQVRYATLGGETQIMFDLSELPTDLEVEDTRSDVMTVAFSGHLNPALKTSPTRQFPYANLKQLYLEERNGRVQVFIKRSMAKSVKVDADEPSHRLTLSVPNNVAAYISPGVRHIQMTQQSSRGPWFINVLEVDPRLAQIVPEMASEKMGNKARVSSIVQNKPGAIAGINGSFFKQDKGVPLGILINDFELITGPLYDRAALGISPDNRLQIARISLKGSVTLPDGRRVELDTINQPRVQLNQTVLYTSRWGQTAPPIPTGGYQILLQNGRVAEISTGVPLRIPTGGFVISGPATAEMALLANQPIGTPVRTDFHTTPDWSGMKHAIGGGPFLVKDGRIYVDTVAQNFTSRSLGMYEPRSAVGITRDGRLLLVTVDGRQNISVGASLSEMARLLLSLGAVDAMNLDGGSSTQMVVQGRLVNSPSVRNGAAVSNGLIIKATEESGIASRE